MNNAPIAARNSMLGITLLELMTVVVVVGVLSMVALPSYRQYVMRSQRTEAKSALLQLQTNQERFFLANRAYSADPVALGFADSVSERGVYGLAIVLNAQGYVATATPRAGGAFDMTGDAQCTTFTINAQGIKAATGTTAPTCW